MLYGPAVRLYGLRSILRRSKAHLNRRASYLKAIAGDPEAVHLPANGYKLFNLAGTYDFGHSMSAFARIDNLFDCRYQNPLGFQRPGLGVFGGLKVVLGPGGFI